MQIKLQLEVDTLPGVTSINYPEIAAIEDYVRWKRGSVPLKGNGSGQILDDMFIPKAEPVLFEDGPPGGSVVAYYHKPSNFYCGLHHDPIFGGLDLRQSAKIPESDN